MSKLSGNIKCKRTCGVTSSYFQDAQQGSSSISITEPDNRCLALQKFTDCSVHMYWRYSRRRSPQGISICQTYLYRNLGVEEGGVVISVTYNCMY